MPELLYFFIYITLLTSNSYGYFVLFVKKTEEGNLRSCCQMPSQRFRDLAAAGIVDTDKCDLLHISIPAYAAASPHRQPSKPYQWKQLSR